MKKEYLLILTLIIITFCSCENDFDIFGGKDYYKFTSSDNEYLFKNYKNIGEIKKFTNQNNETFEIEVQDYRIDKESTGLLSPGELYYYEQLVILLKLKDVNSNCNTITILVTKNKDGTLWTKITIPSFDRNSCGGIIYYYKHPEQIEYEIIELNIGNKSYKNVLVFEADPPLTKHLTFYENSTIDKVYFDLNEGIIGFDDINNDLKFRLEN
ncbi:MAG: hypothetical protein ACI8RP_001608 [Urechidicola sp.]|jgi:hypothetical protein